LLLVLLLQAARRYIPLITQQKEEAEAQLKHQLNEVKHQLEAQKDELRAAIAQEYSGKVQEVGCTVYYCYFWPLLFQPDTSVVAVPYICVNMAMQYMTWAHILHIVCFVVAIAPSVRSLTARCSICAHSQPYLTRTCTRLCCCHTEQILHQQGQQFEEVMKERLDEQLHAVTSQFK
jgi:hypothetical protein